MTVELRAYTTAYVTVPRWFMIAEAEGSIKVPVTGYLISHPKGTVLFDTGLHPATQHDPVAHVGERLASLHDFDFHPGQEVAARLEAADTDPNSVTHVVNSHLHFDHCGGNASLPNATIICQRTNGTPRNDQVPGTGTSSTTSTPASRSSSSTASTTSSATEPSSSSRPAGTPPATNRSASAPNAGASTSCAEMPAISSTPSTTSRSPASSPTPRRRSPHCSCSDRYATEGPP